MIMGSEPVFCVDIDGNYLGSFSGVAGVTEPLELPNGAIKVPTAPDNALQKWDFTNKKWLPLPII